MQPVVGGEAKGGVEGTQLETVDAWIEHNTPLHQRRIDCVDAVSTLVV